MESRICHHQKPGIYYTCQKNVLYTAETMYRKTRILPRKCQILFELPAFCEKWPLFLSFACYNLVFLNANADYFC